MESEEKSPSSQQIYLLLGVCVSEMAKLYLATLKFINILLFKKNGFDEIIRVFDGLQISTIQKKTLPSIYDVAVKENEKYDSLFYSLNLAISKIIDIRNIIIHFVQPML